MRLEDEIKQKKFKNEFQKAAVNLIYTTNWLEAKFAPLMREFGLTVQQFNILRILRGQHPTPATINLLKERMLDKMSDASRLVDRLLEKGYLSRQVCGKDRRRVDILITQSGLDLLEKIDVHEQKFYSELINLTSEEADLLNNLLDKFRG
ncbi:MAG: MarR family transcriptional regulator [Ignavibacteriales bacterium]|jgi:DNA-binding MarR family transcriptional regulator|nr:MarR family transcriptional regulator [Ignavibacteriales bacterium]MBP7543108.1 MarR family transcriptional regulator [Ignavibacteriaceae bacterium]MBP9121681.1 MarR family transcriptional regulator [Ignavibacteriaceae bacterium]